MNAGTASPLTVVTYNIHQGFSALNRRLVVHEIRERLHSLAPDVVFPQECRACTTGTRAGISPGRCPDRPSPGP